MVLCSWDNRSIPRLTATGEQRSSNVSILACIRCTTQQGPKRDKRRCNWEISVGYILTDEYDQQQVMAVYVSIEDGAHELTKCNTSKLYVRQAAVGVTLRRRWPVAWSGLNYAAVSDRYCPCYMPVLYRSSCCLWYVTAINVACDSNAPSYSQSKQRRYSWLRQVLNTHCGMVKRVVMLLSCTLYSVHICMWKTRKQNIEFAGVTRPYYY